MAGRLETAVGRVVRSGNCTGCGACALVSDRIELGLSDDGFIRPRTNDEIVPDAARDAREAAQFRRVCPGVGLTSPRSPGQRQHPILGAYVEAWQGWAADEEIRRAGSSGGALTAIGEWLIASGRAPAVRASSASTSAPTRTVPVRITTRDEALAAAGSRYAPVASAASAGDGEPFVGKPCEVAAVHNLAAARGDDEPRPILLSFFCAGTPSQSATDRLVEELGGDPAGITELRYRGDGWPGSFRFQNPDGTAGEMSYQQSWGKRLGRELQTRCKLCVDGTGEHADISVGDFWESDADGFPVFEDALGNSVIIARTERGAALVRKAAEEGILLIAPVDLDDVARVQPLQTLRRRTLVGRLLGRAVAGARIPRYRGYGLLGLLVRDIPGNIKAAVGMFTRTAGLRR